jgi:hypothetical protein
MAPRPEGWINWGTSLAKKIIMLDLEEGILALNEEDMSAEEAWKTYRHMAEFESIVFDQFKAKLADNREQVQALANRSAKEEYWMSHDRLLHPRQMHNDRGEPVFDLSVAKLLLREDVIANRHVAMKPSEFQRTRTEYMAYKPRIFKDRIYQEVRRKKYLYYLELKRTRKRNEI